MKIITYNVNGIRAVLKKGFLDWLKATDAQFICLQEVKAERSQIDTAIFEDLGYQVHWFAAEKKGYSGVAILSKVQGEIKIGMGLPKYDSEGRVLQISTPDFTLLNTYMPSGSSGWERQLFKFDWLADFHRYISELLPQHPRLIVCGDYNICHKPIDIHNPVSNAKSSGFLPEERSWFDSFMALGFADAFRVFNPEPHQYTWWSTRGEARKKNLGWRIDYQLVSLPLVPTLQRCQILNKVTFSDHCPVLLELQA